MSNSHHTFASPAEALRALFAAWPSDKGEGTGFAEAYIIAIQGYSLKAIDGAVKRIIRGEADDIDRRFLPSSAQVGNLCAYLEKIYAPPEPVKYLPAPSSAERTPEEQARAASFVDRWRKSHGGGSECGEIITDREAVPQAKLAELDKAVERAASNLRDGRYRLSPEALRTCLPDPAEQYDAWDSHTPDPEFARTE